MATAADERAVGETDGAAAATAAPASAPLPSPSSPPSLLLSSSAAAAAAASATTGQELVATDDVVDTLSDVDDEDLDCYINTQEVRGGCTL